MTEITAEPDLYTRLRTAFATAMKHSHDGGRVELHLGPAVVDHLRSLCTIDVPDFMAPTCWGFPVVTGPALPPDHISVHIVHHIF